MQKYLFQNFSEDKLVYQICQSYWATKMDYFFEQNAIHQFSPYLNTKYANGIDFSNGNPIVNYYFQDFNKAIRIIQEEPCGEDLEITAWIDTFEMNETNYIPELVISIQLTPQTEQLTFDLLSKWIVANLSPQKMQRYIDLKLEIASLEVLTA